MGTTTEQLARGLDHHRAGRLESAETEYRRILGADPVHADALHLLGVLAHQRGEHAEAAELIARAITENPRFADFHSNLGNVLWHLGRLPEAEASCRWALALREAYPEAHVNLGNVLWAAGCFEEAASAYRRALALQPDYAEAHSNLGNVLRAQGRPGEAEACYRRALALAPDFVDALGNLAVALRTQGRIDEAIAAYEQALARVPGDAALHSNLIFSLDFHPRTTAAAAFAERRRWNQRHARALAARVAPHANVPDPERRLRIGYVSADFRRHSAAVVFAPVLLAHARDAFEVVCYADVPQPDEVTARLRDAATLWRETAGLSDAAVAARIRDDGIDVLVDLSGHSAGNRLLVFARKPAPVQVTAWGHAVGTGLDAMDYFLADPTVVPAEARGYFSEAVVDLPSLVCYGPPGDAPAVTPPPALGRGFPTFGCLNRQSKMSPEALRLWAAILGALPAARLLLKDEAFNEPATRERLLAQLVGRGVDAGRVDFLGGSPRREHLAAYGEVDLVLDPFPHGGGVSALEGLWMGVPMVTLLGERPPGRMGASFLSTLGLDELVAPTPERYVDVAVEHARSPERLAGIRSGLRQRMARSILCDHAAYCRAVEGAYRAMWRRWCASQQGDTE